jgi:CheY-like chemotaxis protein
MPRETVLIALANDNAMILSTLSTLLTDWGYPMITSSLLRELEELVQRERPDIVIAHVYSDSMNAAIQVIQQMRSNPTTATIPVILYSTEIVSLSEQVDGLLVDPYSTILDFPDFATLLATIAKLTE